jgi:Leucine-rich repeat (LRR) protein
MWTSRLKECRAQSSLKQAVKKPLEVFAFRLQGQWSAIPDQIANFLNLEILILKGNGLTSLPDWLSQLKQLRCLELSNNQVPSIPELPQLEELEISSSHLIPTGISNLGGLRSLSLSYCQEPSSLEALPPLLLNLELNSVATTQLPVLPQGLERLKLRQTPIQALPTLPKLRELSVQFNLLEKSPNLPDSLEILELSSVGIDCAPLPEMPNLRQLDLSLNPTRFPDNIERFEKLERLFMVDCGLTELPQQMAQLRLLHWINLNVNQLTSLPQGLTQLQNLALLHVKANRLRSVPDFSQSQSLKDVMLGGNPLPDRQLESHFPPDCRVDRDDAGLTISQEDLRQRLGAHFGLQSSLVPLRIPAGWTLFANDFRETPQAGDNRELFQAGHRQRIVRLEAWDGIYQLSLENVGQDVVTLLATFRYNDWESAQIGLNSALEGTLQLPKTGLPD